MLEKKEQEKKERKQAPAELDLDDLNAVQGGSLRNAQATSTSSISSDTRNKI